MKRFAIFALACILAAALVHGAALVVENARQAGRDRAARMEAAEAEAAGWACHDWQNCEQ